jgi:NADPH:quinone reductase-like Zn-dependent oxidoreductase
MTNTHVEQYGYQIVKGWDIPDTMRALTLHAYDGADLRVEQLPLPHPGPGEVLIRMHAAPINPSDLMFVRGMYGFTKQLPVVPGFEGSGTVVAVGRGLAGAVLLGRRVACAAPDDGNGTWAEYMRTDVQRCIPLLPSVSSERGAMLIVNPLTAWALVDLARRGKHRAVVQTAAASALGKMIVRLAQRDNLPLINIVRREEQAAQLRAIGATHVLDSSRADFDEQLHNLCHILQATLALDAVAGEMTGRLLQAMPRGSRVTVYGALSEAPCQIHPIDPIFRGKSVDGFWLSDWFRGQNTLDVFRAGLSVQQLLGSELKSEVRACMPLEEGQRGLQLYANRMTEGKVLLMPGLRR